MFKASGQGAVPPMFKACLISEKGAVAPMFKVCLISGKGAVAPIFKASGKGAVAPLLELIFQKAAAVGSITLRVRSAGRLLLN